MECNRDEAVRAKEISESKFLAKDLKGAKKFALKARNLYPELEGISQMVMNLEVYISAEEEKKIRGESNWYGVLGVTPIADDETIRKQYRKLALLLHPDKNRSIGAEGAFQLVSQAWSLLSDKSKREAYDQRYHTAFQQRNHSKKEGPSPPATQNGFYNFATAPSQAKVPKGNSSKKNNTSSAPHPSRKKEHRHTFWTVCHRCKMQYEYLRMYLNHNLLCPNCQEAYFAVEIDPPSFKSSKPSSTQTSQSRNNSGVPFNHGNQYSHNNFEWVPFSEPTGAESAVHAANMVKQAYEKVKRERQKAQAAARREEALRRKSSASKRTMGAETSGRPDYAKRRKGMEECGVSKEKMNQVNCEIGMRNQVNSSGPKQNSSFQKCASKHDGACHADIKHLLMEKARGEVHKNLNAFSSASVVRNVAGEDVGNTKENETASIKDGRSSTCNQIKLCESRELVEQMTVDVSDPDFHDFDKDRTEKCFGKNQVWAVYDDDDGMPRHYAMIRSVISLNPLKVTVSWLISVTHSRLEHVSWLSGSFSKTCGEFVTGGRVQICNSIDCFSHRVKWTKQTSKIIRIFPRKGDVWALYRNWSFEWNELTEDEVIHIYDMVEVLEDYDEELGVIVIPLVKVAGFKAIFHQHFNPMEIRRIPKEEISRFSHQVPSRFLTGQEGSKSPKGCLELDPAAIPSQLLEVASNAEEIEFIESDEDGVEIVKEIDHEGNTVTNIVDGIS